MMAMGFRHWAGQDRGHYYSISIPFIVFVAIWGGIFALVMPILRWMVTFVYP